MPRLKARFAAGEVPLPAFWGGYRVAADTVEFWQARENRLHDRFLYSRGRRRLDDRPAGALTGADASAIVPVHRISSAGSHRGHWRRCRLRRATAARLPAAPPLEEFCLEAQRVIVRTAVTPALIVHPDFDGFVKSKAAIEPLTIQQYIWYEDDDPARPVMVSCKLKSADHLNEAFGAGTSAGNGRCQDMNRLTWRPGAGRRSAPPTWNRWSSIPPRKSGTRRTRA